VGAEFVVEIGVEGAVPEERSQASQKSAEQVH
jgi:hypothetical protein